MRGVIRMIFAVGSGIAICRDGFTLDVKDRLEAKGSQVGSAEFDATTLWLARMRAADTT
jgi:hypothetical protein